MKKVRWFKVAGLILSAVMVGCLAVAGIYVTDWRWWMLVIVFIIYGVVRHVQGWWELEA